MLFKRKGHRISVFYEYMLSYFSVLLIAALLGFTLIQKAGKQIEAGYIEQKNHCLEMMKTQIDNLTDGLLRSSYLLAMDDTRRQMIIDPSPYNEFMLKRELKQLKPSNLGGGNLFLCLADSNYVYDGNGKSEIDRYWNAIMGMTGREDMISSWLDLSSSVFVPCVNDDGETQLMFVFPLKYVTWYAGDREAFIVTYFSPYALGNLAKSIRGDIPDDFVVCSNDTPVITSLKNIPEGTLTDLLNGSGFYEINPEYPGLSLTLIAGDNEVLRLKSEYLHKLFLIMLPFMLFGIALVIWHVFRNYKPIRQLANNFETGKGRMKNEILLIGEGIESINRKDSELIERIGEINQELKQILLEDVIDGIRAEKEELAKAGITLDGGICSILCVRGKNENSISGLRAMNGRILYDGVKATWSEKYVSLIIMAPKAENAREIGESILSMVSGFAGIGYFADGENGIRRAFLQALSACREAEMNGNDILIYNSETKGSVDGLLASRYMYLEKAIQGGNAALSLEILNDIRMRIEKMGVAEAKCENFVLLNTLRRCASDLNMKMTSDDLYQAVSSERTDILYAVMDKFTKDMCGEVVRRQTESNLSMQTDIIRYIEEHFADYEISMERICVQFKLSVNSLSHIVKDKTDCTPREYIIKLRMEEAQRLLLQTDESVNSISKKVGYAGASHFIKTFKQYYNITPSQMRGGKP